MELPPKIFRNWVERCTVDVVRLLLEHGMKADIDTLITVVKSRRGDILQLFVDSGVDFNKKSETVNTPLHTAVIHCIPQRPSLEHMAFPRGGGCTGRRRPQLLKAKLVRKIEPAPQQLSARCMSATVEKCTPEDIVRCLIRGDADLNVPNAQGLTPLALAEKGPPSVQQLLVDSGAK